MTLFNLNTSANTMGIIRDITLEPQRSLQEKYDDLWRSFWEKDRELSTYRHLLRKIMGSSVNVDEILRMDFNAKELEILTSIKEVVDKQLPDEDDPYTITVPDLMTIKVFKRFGKDFDSDGGALTLSPSDVRNETGNNVVGKGEFGYPIFKLTHDDGWTIEGIVHEDYYEWVNYFRAEHPKYGKVWGNFEDCVYAESEEGFEDFYKNHTPRAWDYQDI